MTRRISPEDQILRSIKKNINIKSLVSRTPSNNSDTLFLELGALITNEVQAEGIDSFTRSPNMRTTLRRDLLAIGRAFFSRWIKYFHLAVCNNRGDNPLRNQILELIKEGSKSAEVALAAIIVAHFGVAAAVAALLAALIVRGLVQSSALAIGDELCERLSDLSSSGAKQ